MNKRPPIIAVRPRKGSDLEAAQQANKNDMADILHSWATAFAENVKQSEQGETEQ